jgi:hypothetical protein
MPTQEQMSEATARPLVGVAGTGTHE